MRVFFIRLCLALFVSVSLCTAAEVQTAPPDVSVNVCVVVNTPFNAETLFWAEATSAMAFDRIGIKLVWSCSASGNSERETVRLEVRESLRDDPPRGLGFALPYAQDGVRAVVLYDRCQTLVGGIGPSPAGAILGHVMSHELGHVLAGTDSHADAGMMRANWEPGDFAGMRIRPLDFEPQFVILMQHNLASRHDPASRNGSVRAD